MHIDRVINRAYDVLNKSLATALLHEEPNVEACKPHGLINLGFMATPIDIKGYS